MFPKWLLVVGEYVRIICVQLKTKPVKVHCAIKRSRISMNYTTTCLIRISLKVTKGGIALVHFENLH